MAALNYKKLIAFLWTLQAKVQGRALAILSVKRPFTDARLKRLIPSLAEACDLKVIAPAPYEDLVKPQLSTPPHRKVETDHVRNTPLTENFGLLQSKATVNITYANSIDLQLFTHTFQRLFGQKTWLDLLENDFTNTQQNRRRSGLRLSTSLWIIKQLQKLLPWNNIVSVAEESFLNEIKFGKCSPVVLSHEMVGVEHFERAEFEVSVPQILITGTLGRHYGSLDALKWSASLLPHFPHQLRMVGPCPDSQFEKELRQKAATYPHVDLEIFPIYRPQSEILNLIAQADYLLTPYHVSPATRNRIPTKFHEAATLGTPIIFPANPTWERWCRSRGAAYFLMQDFPSPPATSGRIDLPTAPWLHTRKTLQWNAAVAGLRRLG